MSASSLVARFPYPSRNAGRALGIAAVVTQAGIGVTGSVVRVTGSGLGCPTWPQCHQGSMFPVQHPEFAALNQWIEFGNRMLTGIVGLVALACVLAAWRIHLGTPGGRKRPFWLALTVLGGTGLQGVIGGITVRTGLLWWTVAIHFVVSAALVWTAVVLLHSFLEGDQRPRWLIGGGGRSILLILAIVLGALVTAGTVLTGAGPHGGDTDTPRLNAPIELLAQVHGGFLVAFLIMLALLGLRVLRVGAPKRFVRRYVLLWVVALAQGALGSVQYALRVPEELVSLHVLGSALVLIATAALWSSARDRGPLPGGPDDESSEPSGASGTVLGTDVSRAA